MASVVDTISRFQFITMDNAEVEHLQQVTMACEAGIDWIQLRMKNVDEHEYYKKAIEAKKICDGFNCRLIINDHVQVAHQLGAYGVHVGKLDMPVSQVRAIVGKDMIVGGTANTVEDIIMHAEQGADYIGLGPFRFTTTKKKLSPVLDTEGYTGIINKLKGNGISIPVVAIGGILLHDITALTQTGVHGIAFSGLLLQAVNKKEVFTALQKQWMPRASH